MASEFPKVSIGDLVDRGHVRLQTGPFGSQLHKHDYIDEGIPVIPTEAIGRGRIIANATLPMISEAKAEELSRHRLRLGDLLFARRGIQATGLSAIVEEKHVGSICGTGALLLRADPDEVDPKFLAAYLSTAEAFDWLRSNAVGAVMPNLNTSILSKLRAPMPPMGVQTALGQFFAGLDDRIDLLRQTNATLEAIAQALFKSWFVDFDPVRAKAEGREPESMDAETAAVFPSEFEESELGLIPRGWGVSPFADTVNILGGGTPKTSVAAYWGGDTPWFSVVDAPANGQVFTVATEKSVTPEGIENSSTRVLPTWTTIVSARGTVGKLAMTACPMAMNQSCYGLSSRISEAEPLVYLAAQRLVTDMKRLAHGGVFDTITRDTLASVFTVAPPSEVQLALARRLKPLFERIQSNVAQVATLSALRDTLLPRLISGNLRLPDATAAIEGATA